MAENKQNQIESAEAFQDGAESAGQDDSDLSQMLNQDEIDSLLGAGEDDNHTGVNALLNSSTVSYERLPMLEIVFDRLVRLTSTTLRNFTQSNIDITLESIESMRFGDYLESIPSPAMMSRILGQVLHAPAKPRMSVAMSFTGFNRAAMPKTTVSASNVIPRLSRYSPRERRAGFGGNSTPL